MVKVKRLIGVCLKLLGVCVLAACNKGPTGTVQGYVEGDYLRISLPQSGIVSKVLVERGQYVKAGEALFVLDDQSEAATVEKAEALLKQAEAQQANLTASERETEIKIVRAELQQAQEDLRYSQMQYDRHAGLVKTGAMPAVDFDRISTELKVNKARVEAANHRLAKAREGVGRKEEVRAAAATVNAQLAALNEAKSMLQKRRAFSPRQARVEDVLYREGETATSGQPVISLLPPENVRLRFFLNPGQLGLLKPDAIVQVKCTGCAEDLTARISFISREASYTPSILYSRDQADKLVFMVEATPLKNADRLHPGQPVTIRLQMAGQDS